MKITKTREPKHREMVSILMHRDDLVKLISNNRKTNRKNYSNANNKN